MPFSSSFSSSEFPISSATLAFHGKQHLAAVFPFIFPRMSSPPLISSPFRKLERSNSRGRKNEFVAFEEILGLTPQEFLELHQSETNYICGVSKGRSLCKRSLYCTRHLFEERTKVERSSSLVLLMKQEIENRAFVERRRHLTEMYYECKAHWRTPLTCTRSSCETKLLLLRLRCSPLKVTPQSKNERHTSTFRLMKELFCAKLARTTGDRVPDMVAYLHYKLNCYESVDETIRARELEARFQLRPENAKSSFDQPPDISLSFDKASYSLCNR